MAFNDTVMRFAFESPNAGPLEGATRTGVSGVPGGGRYIKVHVIVEGGLIKEAKWESNGCPASMACASMVCTMACGKPVDFPGILAENDVIVMLNGLPEGKDEMARMAVEALRKATERE